MNEVLSHALVMLLGVLIAGFSQLLLKKAAGEQYTHWIYQYLNVRVIAGYTIMVLSTLCTVYAYKVIPLSMSPIWEAAGQIIVAMLSFFVLREKVSRRKLIGLAVILVGILVYFIVK